MMYTCTHTFVLRVYGFVKFLTAVRRVRMCTPVRLCTPVRMYMYMYVYRIYDAPYVASDSFAREE